MYATLNEAASPTEPTTGQEPHQPDATAMFVPATAHWRKKGVLVSSSA